MVFIVFIIGIIAGFKGAIDVWEWSFLEAGALFFGPFLSFCGFGAFIVLIMVFEDKYLR